MRELADAGVERCVFNLPDGGAAEVLPVLDELAELVDQFKWEKSTR
jgi:hypothetical protein